MTRVIKKYYILLAAIATLLLTSAQCSQSTETSPPSQKTSQVTNSEMVTATEEPNSGQVIELSIAWWGSQSRHDRTIEVIELFEQQHPNIKINYEFTDWNDYWPAMKAHAENATLPDIMQQDYARLEEWISKGWLMPLDEFADSGPLDFSHVSDTVIDAGRIDEQLYGVSLGTNPTTFVLDVDAFEKAGIELPPPNWTWADFETTANEIHNRLDIWGIGERLIVPDLLWQSHLLGYEQRPYTSDGGGLAYTDKHLVNY